MAAARTMRFEYVDRVFVGVHTAETPRDDEWERHCENLERERTHALGVLVFTLGGGPNTHQRRRLRDAMHDTPAPPTAIMTSSTLVRGIITSLNWFANDQLGAFEPNDLDGALRHVRRTGAQLDKRRIVATLATIATELSVALPANWAG